MGFRGDAIAQLDWCVGKLLETLDELEVADNTLVLFTSDNGPVLDDGYHDLANERIGRHHPAGPFRGGKYSPFEGGTRVPLIVRWPGHVPTGDESSALVGQIDFARSLAQLVGADVPDDAVRDSRNQLDALLGRDPVGRPHLIHEAGTLALRQAHWKYIPPCKPRDGLGPWQPTEIAAPGALFDLRNDPGEQLNLAMQHPQQLRDMADLLARLRADADQ